MANGLNSVRESVHSIGDAVRTACVLEASAPKAGNVYPGQSFDSLHYQDFVVAADLLARAMSASEQSTAQRALVACKETYAATATNVNLGIVLLMSPLVGAAELGLIDELADWPKVLEPWLCDLDTDDSIALFNCVRVMAPGGMGKVDEMDVDDSKVVLDDIVAAMKLAADRDRVAMQYACNFVDLIQNVVPIVNDCLRYSDDVLSGISDAHLRLLAAAPDTLIVRKCGVEIAADVQQRAQAVDLDDDESRQAFDRFLRSDGNRLNPGTTADLIAASLFVLISTSNERLYR